MSGNTRPTLLNRLREATDAMAWREFFGCYGPVVFAYARRRGCSEHTAEEIVQDVMLIVFEKRQVFQYDPARGRFRNWLHRVVNNRVAERRRAPGEQVRTRGGDQSHLLVEPPDGQPAPDAAWDDAFDLAVLAAMVEVVRRETDPRDFVAFELTALHDCPPGEAARLVSMSRNMVYKARRRVIQRLRQLAGGYAEEGRLCCLVRQALQSLPSPAVQRSLTSQIAESMERATMESAVGSNREG